MYQLENSELTPALSEALNTSTSYIKEELRVDGPVILQVFIFSASQKQEEGVIIVEEKNNTHPLQCQLDCKSIKFPQDVVCIRQGYSVSVQFCEL